jgi:hypothetical protein
MKSLFGLLFYVSPGVEAREAFIRSKYEFHAFIDNPYMEVNDANESLIDAAEKGNVFRTLLALAHGADVNVQSKRHLDGSPLHIAGSRGYVLLVDALLLNGGSLESLDSRTATPLEGAMLANQIDVVELLSKRLDDSGRSKRK